MLVTACGAMGKAGLARGRKGDTQARANTKTPTARACKGPKT